MEMPSISLAKRTEKSFDLSKIMMFAPSIGAVLLSIAIFALVVWPKFTEARQLNEQNKVFEVKAVKLEDKATRLAKLDREQLRVQLAAAELLLPSDKSIFSFIRQIEGVSDNSGVIVGTLNIGKVGEFSPKKQVEGNQDGAADASGQAAGTAATPPPLSPTAGEGKIDLGDVEMVTATVSITSNFDQVFTFLNGVYSLPRVSTISGLNFSIDNDGLIGANMEIHSLWQSRPVQLASVEEALPELGSAEVELLRKIEKEGVVGTPVEIPDVPRGKSNIFSDN